MPTSETTAITMCEGNRTSANLARNAPPACILQARRRKFTDLPRMFGTPGPIKPMDSIPDDGDSNDAEDDDEMLFREFAFYETDDDYTDSEEDPSRASPFAEAQSYESLHDCAGDFGSMAKHVLWTYSKQINDDGQTVEQLVDPQNEGSIFSNGKLR